MRAGKLPPYLLSDLLDSVEIRDRHVVLGPRVGEDAALIDLGPDYLVAKTDPITFATDLIGWYLVQINANDLAVMGAKAQWLMATLLLPVGIDQEQVRIIFDQITAACRDADITLVGGHTEIVHDLARPIAIGAMLGRVAKEKVVFTSGAKPGDCIVLTEGIAIEGSAILAREAVSQIQLAGIETGELDTAREFLFKPGISVVKAARIAGETVSVHAMHDPTEGGLATGLLELARAANVGIVVDAQSIPVLPQCRSICRALGLNPLGLIASGALLLTLAPEDVPTLQKALASEGIAAHVIGHTTAPATGLKLKTVDGLGDLPTFDRDELARFFSAADGAN